MIYGREFKDTKNEYGIYKLDNPLRIRGHEPTTQLVGTYEFSVFYHPWICEMIRRLNINGVDELLTWPMGPDPGSTDHPIDLDKTPFFDANYSPDPRFIDPATWPIETLDFATEGRTAYSLYNWELFFHAPLLIATSLSRNQRFEDAQKWFHYIFDPTARTWDPPMRFWRLRPFYEEVAKIWNAGGNPPGLEDLLSDGNALNAQVPDWQSHPFKPHRIAQLRQLAYEKSVLMKYLDNLIAWGDQLFRQDTIESINQATQLYILASEILGPRPQTIPPPARVATTLTFNQYLKLTRNLLNDPLVDIENLIPQNAPNYISDVTGADVVTTIAQHSRYFCLPANDQLLQYWDTIADRLFKIRNCMNIEGVVQQLPLFEPPINPALLVALAAAGVDLNSALNEVSAPLPLYRFGNMLQKANELCAEVKALGGALLSALEKRDAEQLAMLRATHEIDLLAAVRRVKAQQIDEANSAYEALLETQNVVQARIDYYGSRVKISAGEKDQTDKLGTAASLFEGQASVEVIAAILHLIPNTKAGSPFTIGLTLGGSGFGQAIQAFGSSLGIFANQKSTEGSMSGLKAGYDRRFDEWDFQKNLATKEMDQVKKQQLGAQARYEIAQKELENHDKQTDQSQEISDFLRDKFTNQDLYEWMVGQVSALYFQSYQMAYDLAKRAEQAYRNEIGDFDAQFINFGNWDSLKKGLLAGEKLSFDLKRMEAAYLDQNKREHEITKHISLVQLDPEAFVTLRETGQCFVSLREDLFDADYPGHYMRRIKSAAVSIPCVTGPYENVNCTLTLLWSRTRLVADRAKPTRDITGAVQSIVTSQGQNDSGMFETNLRDERYLPFEGSGAISDWRIELPKDSNTFDRSTLSDVVLHLRYTARGTTTFAAATPPKTPLDPPKQWVRLFSATHDFPDAWHAFLNQADDGTPQALALSLDDDYFLPAPAGKHVHIDSVKVLFKPAPSVSYDSDTLSLKILNAAGAASAEKSLTAAPQVYDGLPHADVDAAGDLSVVDNATGKVKRTWTVQLTAIPTSLGVADGTTRLDGQRADDMGFLFYYSFKS